MGGSTSSVAYYASHETPVVKELKRKLSKRCHLRLLDKSCSDLTKSSPLLVFCELSARPKTEANNVLNCARGGSDVFLILIKVLDTTESVTTQHINNYMDASVNWRVGDACIFFFSKNLTTTHFHYQNKEARQRLKGFVRKKHTFSASPELTFSSHRFQHHPVCYYFESTSQMEEETAQFVRSVGKINLTPCLRRDVRSVSPLVVFTPSYTLIDDDVSNILAEARDGQDVFLVLIGTNYEGDSVTSHPRLSPLNKQRIGGCAYLWYWLDRKDFALQENIQALQRLRNFVFDAMDANVTNSLKRSQLKLDDGYGTMV